jgi:transcriptional regulator with XRE-family HTH domain
MPRQKPLRHALRDYCKEHGMTLAGFARQLGVTQGSLSNWISGKRRIRSSWAFRIQEMTGGIVGFGDWLWFYNEHDGEEVDHREEEEAPATGTTFDEALDKLREAALSHGKKTVAALEGVETWSKRMLDAETDTDRLLLCSWLGKRLSVAHSHAQLVIAASSMLHDALKEN